MDTSIISVIKVSDTDAYNNESDLGSARPNLLAGDEQDSVIEVAENLTLSMAQFEMLISDLKTKHLAEKRMLQCDLGLCKKTIKMMAHNIRNQGREK